MKRIILCIFWMPVIALGLKCQIITDPPSGPFRIGQSIGFQPVCYGTAVLNATWDWGDGSPYITDNGFNTYFRYHSYAAPGKYTVQLFRKFMGPPPLPPCADIETLTITVEPDRSLTFSPQNPRADELVTFQAINFSTAQISWNFSDGTSAVVLPATVTHRFQNQGIYTVTAKESIPGNISGSAAAVVTVTPDPRFVTASKAVAKNYEDIVFTANHFYTDVILWDFGDGTVVSGPATIIHRFKRVGTFSVSARDENGKSQKRHQVSVTIMGISDDVQFEAAELAFENGKYYQIVSRNAKNLRAVFKMKMSGTGLVSGQWLVDGMPFELFNENAFQGEVKNISTRTLPGLPTANPGIHTVSVKLLRPSATAVSFAVLKYYVLPYENLIRLLVPAEDALLQREKPPAFSWEPAIGVVAYQVVFSGDPVLLLENAPNLRWYEAGNNTSFTPSAEVWRVEARGSRLYWQVRGVDGSGNVLAESPAGSCQVVQNQAKISIARVTDLDGRELPFGSNTLSTSAEAVLIYGEITSQEDCELLILRVYHLGKMVDQLSFRNVKKDTPYRFETAVQCREKKGTVSFQLLKPMRIAGSNVVGLTEIAVK